jgi:hypothetical protein
LYTLPDSIAYICVLLATPAGPLIANGYTSRTAPPQAQPRHQHYAITHTMPGDSLVEPIKQATPGTGAIARVTKKLWGPQIQLIGGCRENNACSVYSDFTCEIATTFVIADYSGRRTPVTFLQTSHAKSQRPSSSPTTAGEERL